MELMSDKIGAAVAVKMYFGMINKGYIALVIKSFTTAHRIGLMQELELFLFKYKPCRVKLAQDGLVRMPHTAYSWVYEMPEMAKTAGKFGGINRLCKSRDLSYLGDV